MLEQWVQHSDGEDQTDHAVKDEVMSRGSELEIHQAGFIDTIVDARIDRYF